MRFGGSRPGKRHRQPSEGLKAIDAIKATIQYFLRKFGYQLNQVPSRYETKYHKLITEFEELYSEHLLEDLRRSDETRVELLSDLIGTTVGQALYALNCLNESLAMDGDVCEFGVAQGATSALLAHEIRDTNKNLWLFDSFEGLPQPSQQDQLIDDVFQLGSMEAYEGTMSFGASHVQKRLASIGFPGSRVKIVPGFIKDTIKSERLPNKVCFAYLDFDFYEPTVVVLDFLDEVLQTGGAIVLDDYGYFSSGVRTAVEEFLARHASKYTCLLPAKPAEHLCMIRKTQETLDPAGAETVLD